MVLKKYEKKIFLSLLSLFVTIILSYNFFIFYNIPIIKEVLFLTTIVTILIFSLFFYLIYSKDTQDDNINFIADISHELRTPLTGILGFTTILKETELNSEQREFVSTIERSSNNLLNLVNDVLDFSKASSGKMELDSHPFDMIEKIENSIESYITKVAEKYIELGLYIDPSIPTNIMGDSTKISQVMLNLLSNAIKFTKEHGVVNISVKKVQESEDSVKILFSVKDSGIGIREEKIKKIFEAFSQADSSTTREFGGTGLGLTISSRFVSMMGGELKIKSEIGIGTTLFFTLDFKKSKDTKPRVVPDIKQKSIAYIVPQKQNIYKDIDDNLKAYILSTGIPYQTYTKKEIFLLEEHELPDILFINHRYTHEEGLLDRFLALKTNIILITCTDMNMITTLYEKSVSNFIFKPINYTKIVKALTIGKFQREKKDLLLRDNDSDILIAEDNTINQKLIFNIFKRMGISVTFANNGVEAVNLYQNHIYKMILMDIEMPILSGIEATKKIREYEESKNIIPPIPIVALTANNDKCHIDQYLKIGMDDHLAKPIDIKRIKEVLDSYFIKEVSPIKNILLYKETKVTGKIYSSILKNLGYHVDVYSSEEEFTKRLGHDKYQYILFDPKPFDGIESESLFYSLIEQSNAKSFAFTDNPKYKRLCRTLSPNIYGEELKKSFESL